MIQTKKQPEPRYMRFLFLGLKRPCGAIGSTRSAEEVVELRSLPGGVAAWGATLEEAATRLQWTVDAAIARAEENGQSDYEWYQEAYRKMEADTEDHEAFNRGWATAVAQAIAPGTLKRAGASSFEFVTLEPEEACAQQ